jgi:hypothetical protein
MELSFWKLRIAFAGLFTLPLLLAGCRRPHAWTPAPPPSVAKAEDFDIVWQSSNSSGSPRNPEWGSQKNEGTLPPASCTAHPYEDCTKQRPVLDAPVFPTQSLCWLAAPDKHFYGHADWTVAEYEGAIGWLNFGEDWDYDWVLAREGLEGVTKNNFPKGAAQYLELEFDSRETANHFGDQSASWWPHLAQLATNLDFDGIDKHLHPNKDTLACGVVMGLFGLDCDHGCRSEIHPVYAMAIQLNEDPANNQWAVLVRNWGNAGFCSNYNDWLAVQKVSILLPASSLGEPIVSVEQFAGTAGVGCPTYKYDASRKGERLDFEMPTPETGGMAVMFVRMKWPQGTETMQCTGIRIADLEKVRAEVHALERKDPDAEALVGEALRTIGFLDGKRMPDFNESIWHPYTQSYPASRRIQLEVQGPATRPEKKCEPPSNGPQIATEVPTHRLPKLMTDEIARMRNEALLWTVCQQYADHSKTVPKEFEQICKKSGLKAKKPLPAGSTP